MLMVIKIHKFVGTNGENNDYPTYTLLLVDYYFKPYEIIIVYNKYYLQ